MMDWSGWLSKVQGFNLSMVESASLWDMSKAPPVIADHAKIRLLSGMDDDETSDNDDAAHFVSLVPPCAAMVLVEASPDAVISTQYKLDVCLIARDCDGRRIRKCDCVVITIAEC